MAVLYFFACVFRQVFLPLPEILIISFGRKYCSGMTALIIGVTGSVIGIIGMYLLSAIFADKLINVLNLKEKMPIIFMSAKTEELDIIQGLMAGGDDYVVKPFHPLQLMTRVKAQLRRYKQYGGAGTSETILQQGDLVLDPEKRQVWLSGKEISLTNKEYDILKLLLQHRGNVLSMAQIYENVWNEPFFHSENTVVMHMANLRNKLRSQEHSEEIIKTVYGRGYRV